MKAVKIRIVLAITAFAVLGGVAFAAMSDSGRPVVQSTPVRHPKTRVPPNPQASIPPTTQKPVTLSPTTGTPPTTNGAKAPAPAPAPTVVPPPHSPVDAIALLQGLNAQLAQAQTNAAQSGQSTPTASGPRPVTEEEVRAALDAQLKQLGINIPHN